MRTTALLIASALLIPASALAGKDSDVEQVGFNAHTKLFRGVSQQVSFPADSWASLTFIADADSELNANLHGASQLAWPAGDLEHGWSDAGRAGASELITDLSLSAKVQAKVWGVSFAYDLWSRDFTWSATDTFQSLLLPGGATPSATMKIVATEMNVLSKTFDLSDVVWNNVYLEFGGDILPHSHATLTGESIRSNAREVHAIDETVVLKTPDENNGWLPMDAVWKGHVDAAMILQIIPYVEVCDTDWGLCYDLDYNYLWNMDSESGKKISSAKATFEHAIPAVAVADGTIDLGKVAIGENVTREVSVRGMSEATLRGTAVVTGDAWFNVADNVFDSTNSAPDTVTVTFTPADIGDFTATLIFETNDPTTPKVSVPLIGSGVEKPIDLPDDNTDGNDWEDNDDVPQLGAAGCGCSSTAPGQAPLAVLLATLGAVVIRRRRG